MTDRALVPTHERPGWISAADEPEHPLAALEGLELAGGRLRVRLGPRSRFGARYFVLLLEEDAGGPVLIALHHSGPYPSYNWIEVAETDERLGAEGVARLFALLLDTLPSGGHLMVEYDSAQRHETAQALARGVPAIATPLGALLFKLGCGAKFKDWQIAEGGTEGPRKLQAYKPPSSEIAQRWRTEALRDVRAFLARPAKGESDAVRAARERAAGLLPLLQGD
jgi:hypothetical protein